MLEALGAAVTEYTFHPAADLFPLLDETSTAFIELVEDIKSNGLLEPIELFHQQILDGRNRYRACLRAGVEPRFEIYSGTEPYHYVVSKNLIRRHLSEDQRAASAMEAKPHIEAENQAKADKSRREKRGGYAEPSGADSPPKVSHPTRNQLAETFDVSPHKIKQATAIASKDPELLKEVRNGTTPLKEAARQVSKRKPPPRLADRTDWSLAAPGTMIPKPKPKIAKTIKDRLYAIVRPNPGADGIDRVTDEIIQSGGLQEILTHSEVDGLRRDLRAQAAARTRLAKVLQDAFADQE